MNIVREPVHDEPEPAGFIPVRNCYDKLACEVNDATGEVVYATGRVRLSANFKTRQFSIDTAAAYLQMVYENGEFQLEASYPNN